MDENSKPQQDMAAPLHQSGLSRGDGMPSPVLARRSPSLGLNGSIPNGSVMNGEPPHMRKSSGVSGLDTSTAEYLGKHEDAHFLANLLAEERQRCNKHKDNYNTLKQEHRK